jgi:hypothetical protein
MPQIPTISKRGPNRKVKLMTMVKYPLDTPAQVHLLGYKNEAGPPLKTFNTTEGLHIHQMC